MRPLFGRSKAFARSLVLVFLAAATTGEALHVEEHHNPHGNRRERIEEARLRAQEALNHPRATRHFNAGGGDPEPKPDRQGDETQFFRRRRPEDPVL